MLTLCTRLAALATVCAGLASAPGVAAAASPWMPFRASDFDLPAGSRCPFALSGRVVEDQERIRTLATFDDGSPRRERVKGTLIVRYINDDTGASVVRDLTGDALIDFGPDGSSTFTLRNGHLAVGLGAGDPGGPAFLVLSGHGFQVNFAPDGRRTVVPGRGDIENICQTLA
jgi:hypothetical protein